MMKRLIPLLLLCGFEAPARADGPSYSGAEEGFWKNKAVVYAEVVSVANVEQNRGRLTLQVKATLSGSYDAAARPVMEADLFHSRLYNGIRRLPPANTRVVAVLERQETVAPGRVSDPRYWVLPYETRFMPGSAPLIEVAGFDDPKVTDILTRLREVRAGKPEGYIDLLRQMKNVNDKAKR
jgi:hypothetical protein